MARLRASLRCWRSLTCMRRNSRVDSCSSSFGIVIYLRDPLHRRRSVLNRPRLKPAAIAQADMKCTYTLDYFAGCDNLAIYHLTATVISRARGQRIVATAAARSATRLYDERYAITHNHTGRTDVVHSEILAPPDAPGWVFDRSVLWNRVEASERRKDSQLARSIEISLPRELTQKANLALVREYLEQ